MVKSTKITADAAKGSKKMTDFFANSPSSAAAGPARATRSRTASAATGSTADVKSASAQGKAPARSTTRRAVAKSASVATLPPSSSPPDNSLADSSAFTLVPDVEMASPDASPSHVRRSTRPSIAPPLPRVTPLTSRQTSPTKARAPTASPTARRKPASRKISLGPKPLRVQPKEIRVLIEPDDPNLQPQSPNKKRRVSGSREFVDLSPTGAADLSDVPPSGPDEQEMSLKARGKRRAAPAPHSDFGSPLTTEPDSEDAKSEREDLKSEPEDVSMADPYPAGDTQEVEGQLSPPGATQTPPRTSPLDELPPSSPPFVPVVLDAATKTEQMIAAIKARAAAAAVSSDEDRPRGEVPRELSPDLSEDDFDFDYYAKPVKPKTPARKKIQSSPIAVASGSSRYAFRDREKSTPQATPSLSKPRAWTKTADPLAAMLREKRAAERRGYDAEALMDTDTDLGTSSPTDIEGDVDDEDRPLGTATPLSDLPSTPERVSEFDAGLQMLGEEDGKAVGVILEEDRALKRRLLFQAQLPGVPFWDVGHSSEMGADDTMAETLSPLVMDLPQLSEAATSLMEFVNGQDHAKALFFFNAHGLAYLTDDELRLVLPWLVETVFSPTSPLELADAILEVLAIDLAGRKFTSAPLFPAVLGKLIDLWPIRPVLAAMDWTVPARMPTSPLNSEVRDECISRFVRFLTVCAEHSWVAAEEITDLLLLVTMIGMDPNVPEDHVYNLKMAIDSLGKMIPSANQEAVVAGRLAAWVSQLDLANCVHFFTIFKGSTPSPTMRISRSIAHRLLTRDAEYGALPPLEPLEELLRASDGPFAIAKETDFEAFYLHVQLVSAALAGLEDYVAAEKRGAAPRLPSIGDALDRLHGRIQDTRAANMDRSRTKGALLRLSMRLLHQRNDLLRAGDGGGAGKPRKLTEWLQSAPPA